MLAGTGETYVNNVKQATPGDAFVFCGKCGFRGSDKLIVTCGYFTMLLINKQIDFYVNQKESL